MRIAIAVTVQDNAVEKVLVYAGWKPVGSSSNFNIACAVAKKSCNGFDGDPEDSDYKKPLRCRTYPLVDGEIHVEEMEV